MSQRLFAIVLLVGCAEGLGDDSTSAPLWTGDDDAARALEDEVLELVNRYRFTGATCGGQGFGSAAPLEADEVLRGTAREHSADMAQRGFQDHVNPDGADPFDRMAAAGFDGADPWGENVAAGYATAEEVVAGWMSSPGHCANIMEPSFAVLGVGYFDHGVDDPNVFRHYWTQNFAGSH